MNRHSIAKTGILLSLLALAAARPATAEVIAIKSGTFAFEGGEGRLDVSGTHNSGTDRNLARRFSREVDAPRLRSCRTLKQPALED